MNYRLEINDELGWIGYILLEHNSEDCLVFDVDFHPKYLEAYAQGFMESEDNIPEDRCITLFFHKGKNTLRAEGEQIGTIKVFVDEGTYESFAYGGRYNVRLVIVKCNFTYKLVYPKEEE